ncbi:uncharacterized protein LOC116172039 isoform X2 [Photinus pyralis]|nr:uncharacterized protein LOC116172039 isoform X2 [Photinus pyralis]
MSTSEMSELYRVLNHSKTTATAEDEQRRTIADANSNYDFVDEMRLNSVPVKKSEQSELRESQMDVSETSTSQTLTRNSSITDENVDPKQRCNDFDSVDVFNSAPTKHPPLTLISYKPKYNPPLYCDPKFIKLNLEERKRLLSEYHRKLIQIYDTFQRKSKVYAPLGKPVQPDIKFNGTLLKGNDKVISYDFEDEDLFVEDNLSDIYITKTGRQTKRKLYTESLNDSWRNKSSSHHNQDYSPTSSVSKRRNISTLNNDQIMKRSKIFSPKSERLFDKLKEKEEQEKELTKETKKFVDSLANNSDEDYVDDSTDVAELVHAEEAFTTRRIVPPNPTKNSGKRRGRGGKSKAIKNSNKKAASGYDVEIEDKSQSSTSNIMGACPICGLEFVQDVLATHADKCIDSFEQKDTSTTILFNGSDRITCENCDEVLPFNTEYEVHVRECLAKST